MKLSKPIKVGVIGVGHLGQHHVKHFASLPGAILMGVYDLDTTRANEIAKQYKTKSYRTVAELLSTCDAISIVTPTTQHAEIAELCIKSGKHVFIEKPITKTVAEADHLLSLTEKNGTVIQVGHIERLNPALLALKGFELKPKFIEVQRLAPYTVRGTEVPVVLDLMIHDIDIILSLVDSPVKTIRASGVSIMTNSVDIANARIRFENGTVANLTSSRIAQNKVRKLKLFQRDMYVTIDFLLGLTEVYRSVDSDIKVSNALVTAPLDSNGRLRAIVYEKPTVEKIDALRLELTNFIESIQGKAKPIVDGKAGRDALEVATNIHKMIIEDVL
ncbi:Gfo/Idh/MocA family oxidoreductase [bacterium]|nr:Gfo/Idh/MocA family oxidoreductase [bacterium]